MNVAELVATLVLDSAGFQSEIRKVDATLSQTGQKAESMAQTLGTSVESAVESSVSKAGKSFAKLAKTANSALAQWDGAGTVQKAAQACQEQSAMMEKAAHGVAGKAADTLTQGLERAQNSVQAMQSRLPKWIDVRHSNVPDSPDSPDAHSTTALAAPQEKHAPSAVIEKKSEDLIPVLPPEPEQIASATGSELSSRDLSSREFSSRELLSGDLSSGDFLSRVDASALTPRSVSSALVMPPEILESVAAAVSEAMRQAVNQAQAVVPSAPSLAQTMEQPIRADFPDLSVQSVQSVQLAPPEQAEAATLSALRSLPEIPSDVGSKSNVMPAQADTASSVLAQIFPENLPVTLSEGVARLVTTGVSESVSASMAAITPHAAESFAQSGAQLAQTVLTGLQNSVASVLEKVPLMVAPSVSAPVSLPVSAGFGPTQTSTEQTADAASLPDPQSVFPSALYEPLAVTPPRAEPFAADFGNTITSQTSISQITINSQATDAEGIADDIGGELERRNLGYQFDGAYSV